MSCRAQVLTAFLLSPAHHEQLLPLLRRWPPQLYSVAALTEATLHRCGPVACAIHMVLLQIECVTEMPCALIAHRCQD